MLREHVSRSRDIGSLDPCASFTACTQQSDDRPSIVEYLLPRNRPDGEERTGWGAAQSRAAPQGWDEMLFWTRVHSIFLELKGRIHGAASGARQGTAVRSPRACRPERRG